MEDLWLIALGAVQGATEFLPVSSSGHLAAGQILLGSDETGADSPLLFEILVHLATLLAVVAVYRRDLIAVVEGAVAGLIGAPKRRLGDLIEKDDRVNTAACLVIGSIPTALVGLALRDPAGVVAVSPLGLGASFLGCACLLFASRWWRGGDARLSFRTAIAIGAVQGVAVLPGISRSGVTIAAGLALGLAPKEAARFSFLLAVPAIVGAAALEIDLNSLMSADRIVGYLFAFLAAFAVGLAALVLVVRIVGRGRLWLFSFYVAAIGLASMFVL